MAVHSCDTTLLPGPAAPRYLSLFKSFAERLSDMWAISRFVHVFDNRVANAQMSAALV